MIGLEFSCDGLQVLYVAIAVFMWLMTSVFSVEYMKTSEHKIRYYVFTFLTFLATVGVFLSADLMTLFVFFEMMSFTSYVWVAQEETKEALRAAETYLAVAVIGGLVLLMGMFLLYDAVGTMRFEELSAACAAYPNKGRLYAAGGCMLFGFGAKAGAFPLHIWLPKAHPAAPAPASALLSGILTKTGIFGILVVSCKIFGQNEYWGVLVLCIGVVTMVWGAFLALCSVDLKRTLACSSISQIGFILVGISMQCLPGAEREVAVRGTLLHMVNHSLLKLLLFMAAGVVAMNIHRLNLEEIRGFGRKKPFLNVVFLIGALGIGGIPLGNAYVSKTLIHEAIVSYQEVLVQQPGFLTAGFVRGVEWLFLFGGGLTIAYMMKLYICLFVEENVDGKIQREYDAMSGNYLGIPGKAAIGLSALAVLILGLTPYRTMDKIADIGQGFLGIAGVEEKINYFSLTNMKGALISVIIGILLYVFVVREMLMTRQRGKAKQYRNVLPEWFDLEDGVYRPLLLRIIPFLATVFCRFADRLTDNVVVLLRKTVYRDRKLPLTLAEGNYITYSVGKFLDYADALWCHIRHKERKSKISYVHKLAIMNEEVEENNTIISRSLSFGLFMFCFGLCLTLLYLLWR